MSLRSRLLCQRSGLAAFLPSLLLPCALCQSPPTSTSGAQQPGIHQANFHPVIPISPELRGDLLAAHQRYLDAIAAYREAPQDSAVVANKIGVAYHHMFDINDAKKNYERAIHLNPNYAEAINNLGAIYHSQKDYRKAERLYRRAIKLEPQSALFYSNLGTAYFFQKKVKKGAEAYSKAFALDPTVFERGAEARIEEGSSTQDMAYVNYALAKTYAQAGQNERALAYLRKALGEGFSDRRKLMSDPELAAVRETPEFVQLVSRQRSQ